MIGNMALTMNDMLNAFEDLPALQHLMSILLNPATGSVITSLEFNSAMNELLTVYNRNTDNNPNLNPAQKEVIKVGNYVFVSMVHDAILSRMRIVIR